MKNPKGGFAFAYKGYYDDYYRLEVEEKSSLQGSATFVRHKEPKLRHVVDALEAGEKYGQLKYSDPRGDKHGWKHVNHCARFLYIASVWHRKNRAGLWFGKSIWFDKIYEEIYEKIWQMFLRENHLRARARKSALVRTLNGGGLSTSGRIDEESEGAESPDKEEPGIVSTTNGGMRISCVEIKNDIDSFTLDNVVDVTYEQLRDSIADNWLSSARSRDTYRFRVPATEARSPTLASMSTSTVYSLR